MDQNFSLLLVLRNDLRVDAERRLWLGLPHLC